MENSINKDIPYDIWIIEQKDNEPFRFGKSINVGFLEREKISDYIFATGVDFVPQKNAQINMSLSKDIVKPLYGISEKHFVGILIGNRSYRKLNGYANNYRGHGMEDYDFTNYRIKAPEIEVDYSSLEILKQTRRKPPSWENENIIHLEHKKYNENAGRGRRGMFNRRIKKKQMKITHLDGVNNCAYKVLDKIEFEDNVYHLKVDFLHEEQDKLTYNISSSP